VSSVGELQKLTPATPLLNIAKLPTNAYPELRKFTNLLSLDFYATDGLGATDVKLHALANAGTGNVKGIVLLNCASVTDNGVEALARARSLQWLQLEGTSISDESLEVIASQMNLTGLNVARTKVTLNGVETLGKAASLRELTFSCQGEVSAKVCEVIHKCKQVKHIEIVDVSAQLDTNAVGQCARDVGVEVIVRNKGALQ